MSSRSSRKPALGDIAFFASRAALFSDTGKADQGKGQLMFESGEEGEEEEEEEEEEDFKPSDGSENEMETEILDYV